jgi:hypothetical protein
MRWQALIVILALALSMLGSPSLLPEPGFIDQGAFEYFGIERSVNPVLSLCGDMPSLNQCPCKPFPLSLNNASEVVRPLFLSFILTYQDERPPTS